MNNHTWQFEYLSTQFEDTKEVGSDPDEDAKLEEEEEDDVEPVFEHDIDSSPMSAAAKRDSERVLALSLNEVPVGWPW